MDEPKVKIIEFDKYCRVCEFENRRSTEMPCDECLTYGARKESHKPMHFIKKGAIKNGS